MKKRYFLEIAILVLAIIFISFSTQAYTIKPNDVNNLNLETSFLLTEDLCTGIRVYVKDAFSDQPIPGAKVYTQFDGKMRPPVETNPDGYAEIELPTLGYSAIAINVVEKAGYWQGSKISIIHPKKWITLHFRLYPYPTESQ